MTTTKLQLYNIALRACGQGKLSSLTEATEGRYLLDDVWSQGNGAIAYFMEQGHWNFAMRAVQIDASSSVTPSFGFTYAFDKPSDFQKLNMISADENFYYPLTQFEFEGDYIYAFCDPIYLRYVSDDTSWGSDYSKWPGTFTLWAGHWLATQIAATFLNDVDMANLEKRTDRLLVDARSKDANQEPPRFEPPSSWISARTNRTGVRLDRGIRSQLTGS